MNETYPPVKKTTQLKQMPASPGLNFICEADNGISARIVEEVGFKGVWAGGLNTSGALGVTDNNESSRTQVLELVEFMSDATNVPVLLDGDTGYRAMDYVTMAAHHPDIRIECIGNVDKVDMSWTEIDTRDHPDRANRLIWPRIQSAGNDL